MTPKRYFVSYQYLFSSEQWGLFNDVIDEHPVEWFVALHADNPDKSWRLLFWAEISEVDDEVYKDAKKLFEHGQRRKASSDLSS